MVPNLLRFIKLKHYGHFKHLKFFGGLQSIVSFILIFLPIIASKLSNFLFIHLPGDDDRQVSLVVLIFSWLIAILAAINLVKEYLLSRAQLVNIDYKKSLIRKLLELLMDNYGWKGSCRLTLFILKNEQIEIFDRISAGLYPGYSKGKCFFRMGQGVPGKAWQNAWSGEDSKGLLESIESGNVPDNILSNKTELRKYFKTQFGIVDDDIYEFLGNKKDKIKSYMSIGMLGNFKKLSCILSVDSEEAGKFTDFEQLKKTQTGVFRKESGFAIVGREENQLPLEIMKQFVPKIADLINQNQLIHKNIRKKMSKAEEWQNTKEISREYGIISSMVQLKKTDIQVDPFLFPLKWVLRQIDLMFGLY